MKKRFLALALAGVLALSFSGCITSSLGGAKDEPVEITLGDTPLRIGETTVKTMLDAGFELFPVGDESVPLDEHMILEPDSVYDGITMLRGEEDYGLLGVTTESESVPLEDAIIYDLNMDVEIDSSMEMVSIQGKKLVDLTMEELHEMLPGSDMDEDSVNVSTENFQSWFYYDEEGKLEELALHQQFDIDYQ